MHMRFVCDIRCLSKCQFFFFLPLVTIAYAKWATKTVSDASNRQMEPGLCANAMFCAQLVPNRAGTYLQNRMSNV